MGKGLANTWDHWMEELRSHLDFLNIRFPRQDG